MRLHREKYLLFFFCLLMICPQIVSAQDTDPGQISVGEPNPPAPAIEYPAPQNPSFAPQTGVDRADKINWKENKPDLSETDRKPAIGDLENDFRANGFNERGFDFRSAGGSESKNFPPPPRFPADAGKKAKDETDTVKSEGFNWRAAFNQSVMFLGVQHGYAILGQKKTRKALKGKFWKDYIDSVRSLSGWDDGGRFFTNYIAHPMQGSLTGFIYVQNSPKARRQEFGMSGDYWRSRMKAMVWSAAWSTQFEIGPVSQASIGNVGWNGKQTWEDIVTTPTVGTAMLIAEDALDRFIIKNIERRTNNFYIKIFSRMIFNPTRIFANLLRFKEPWHRDRPTAR